MSKYLLCFLLFLGAIAQGAPNITRNSEECTNSKYPDEVGRGLGSKYALCVAQVKLPKKVLRAIRKMYDYRHTAPSDYNKWTRELYVFKTDSSDPYSFRVDDIKEHAKKMAVRDGDIKNVYITFYSEHHKPEADHLGYVITDDHKLSQIVTPFVKSQLQKNGKWIPFVEVEIGSDIPSIGEYYKHTFYYAEGLLIYMRHTRHNA